MVRRRLFDLAPVFLSNLTSPLPLSSSQSLLFSETSLLAVPWAWRSCLSAFAFLYLPVSYASPQVLPIANSSAFRLQLKCHLLRGLPRYLRTLRGDIYVWCHCVEMSSDSGYTRSGSCDLGGCPLVYGPSGIYLWHYCLGQCQRIMSEVSDKELCWPYFTIGVSPVAQQ